MKSVCVLLSAYNGEVYLRQQLDSLLIQRGVELRVLARDDGSSDTTENILKEYSERDSRLSYYSGQNLGLTSSFLDLVRNSGDADYYAFADQDDVWDDDKLLCAVEMLGNCSADTPALYYSNLRVTDSELHYCRLSHSAPHIHKSRYSALVDNMATGCTCVFNRAARELAALPIPGHCTLHDVWLFLLCSLMGNVVYDFTAHISYRQHCNNQIGTYLRRAPLALCIAKIREMETLGGVSSPRFNDAKNFYSMFADRLSPDVAEKVLEVTEYKQSFSNKLRLLFDGDIRIRSRVKDIIYRTLILRGKI